jgi:hypothetical protein
MIQKANKVPNTMLLLFIYPEPPKKITTKVLIKPLKQKLCKYMFLNENLPFLTKIICLIDLSKNIMINIIYRHPKI